MLHAEAHEDSDDLFFRSHLGTGVCVVTYWLADKISMFSLPHVDLRLSRGLVLSLLVDLLCM